MASLLGAGNSNASATDSDDGAAFQGINMTREQALHDSNALNNRRIRKADQSFVRGAFREEKLAKVLVDRNDNTIFSKAPTENRSIAGIGAALPNLRHIMSEFTQAHSESHASTAIDKKLQ